MLVRLRTNLGSIDAAKLKLDWQKCGRGAEVEVSEDVGATLIKRNIAEEVERKVKAVAEQPRITAPAKP